MKSACIETEVLTKEAYINNVCMYMYLYGIKKRSFVRWYFSWDDRIYSKLNLSIY